MAKSTKNEIAAALGELLREKRLDDITVTELVDRCGISRQAFYYHFSDLYGVVDHAMQQARMMLAEPAQKDWYAALEQGRALLRENRSVVLNVYRAYERSYVEHDLYRWIAPVAKIRVQQAAAKYRVTEDQINFMTDLLTRVLASIALSWVERGMPTSVIERLEEFDIFIKGCLDYSIERLAQKNANE